jgi:cellulose synthase/poly-beta-1,6-N-acetylglucosamine synthase-like glycosyltransferase
MDLANIIYILITAAVLGVAIPIAVLVIECLAAQLPHPAPKDSHRGSIAVLIPAHNEASVIAGTLTGMKRQLRQGDRIMVVADNCSDNTAAIARDLGAVVVERFDRERHGKGWALDFGCKALASNPPEVVIVIDADCTLSPGLLDQLASKALACAGPVQSAYEMPPPTAPSAVDTLSSFSILLKNVVRPRGLSALGFPCLLNGSGMAMPWQLIKGAPLAGGHIGEEYQLSIDLAIEGFNTHFLPQGSVYGPLPSRGDVARQQRKRWGHTQLMTMKRHVPRLLHEAVRQKRFDLAALAADVAIPPLSILAFIAVATFAAAIAIGAASDQWAPAAVSGGCLLTFSFVLTLSWFRFGRKTITWTSLLGIPWYLLNHLPSYLTYFTKPDMQWTKTKRDRTPIDTES